ncbi:energy coupling factor transporter S component ThiW [Secundilactobacillus folii]|uniref:Energy coupling factor transporter S component ThiW n=1 Tax=Secundilactobacillus folii TaxID=2678357 RepID=A0A7X3C2K5_9LACO|nr:energy coupling factor transporter S component ThiW [Secundilactobacillus folii]MTV81557.1 energy coupling factor transporter S component ThiW [Secundilactobacillus folii]
MNKRVYYLTLTSVLVALGVIGGSLFEFTVGVAKVAPMQHLINVVSGALLGPWWAVTQAFLTSLVRNLLGTGTILAFPGSMFGAFLSGLFFKYTKKLLAAVFGELIGTGIIGAFAAYPLAAWLLGAKGALWLFVPSFFLSALVGAIVGYALLKSIWSSVIQPQLNRMQK